MYRLLRLNYIPLWRAELTETTVSLWACNNFKKPKDFLGFFVRKNCIITQNKKKERHMAQSFKTSISFGLVYIPVSLFAVIKNNDIGFNMIHKKTKQKVKYIRTCAGKNCPAEIDISDIVKGYEYEQGKYVIITNEELMRLKTKRDETIAIMQFCNLKDIDPIYYDKSYYVVPTGGMEAFALLVKAMEQQNKVAVAKVVLGSKETMVCIRSINGQLILSTMYFYEEVQNSPYSSAAPKSKDTELKLANDIIASMSKPFRPEQYQDQYRQRLQKAIEQKIAGLEIQPMKRTKPTKVLHLLDALKLSLDEVKTPNNAKIATKTKAKSKTKTSAGARKKYPSNVTAIQSKTAQG